MDIEWKAGQVTAYQLRTEISRRVVVCVNGVVKELISAAPVVKAPLQQ